MARTIEKAGELALREGSLMADLRKMILGARAEVSRNVDAALTLLHWQVGNRIRTDILREKRADYGEQIVATIDGRVRPWVCPSEPVQHDPVC